MPVGIPLPWQKQILVPIRREPTAVSLGQGRLDLFVASPAHGLDRGVGFPVHRGLRVIATADVNRLAIGRKTQRMGSVLSSPSEILELFDLVVLVISIGVFETIQTAADTAVDTDIKTVEGVEQSLCRRDIQGDPLDCGLLLATGLSRGYPEESFVVLIADDQSPFRIARNTDPRSEFVFGDPK